MAQVESAVANLDASTLAPGMAKALADALGMAVEVPGAALEVVQVRAGERGAAGDGPCVLKWIARKNNEQVA